MRTFALTDMVSWGYTGLRGAGYTVSQQGAHGIPALYRANRAKAEKLATLDLCCWSGYGSDRQKRDTVPQAVLFRQTPNPQQSRFDFWETIGESLGWRNQAWVWMNTDPATGRILEWYALHPDQVQRTKSGLQVSAGNGYIDPVGRGNARYELPDDGRTLLRIRGHGEGGMIDPPTPIQVFREALQSPLLRMRHESRMWRRGSALQLAVEFPQGVSKSQADDWRTAWRDTYEGADGETTAIVGGGAQIKPIGMTLADAQYVEMANLTIQDASMITGYPASLIARRQGEHAAMGTLEEDMALWYATDYAALLSRIEDSLAANPVLFPTGAQTYPQFDTEGFIRADVQTEDAVAHQQVQDGRLLVDEWRAMKGLPPLPNGAGSVPQITPVGGAPNPNQNAVPGKDEYAAAA